MQFKKVVKINVFFKVIGKFSYWVCLWEVTQSLANKMTEVFSIFLCIFFPTNKKTNMKSEGVNEVAADRKKKNNLWICMLNNQNFSEIKDTTQISFLLKDIFVYVKKQQ